MFSASFALTARPSRHPSQCPQAVTTPWWAQVVRRTVVAGVFCVLFGGGRVRAETTNYSGGTPITTLPCTITAPGTYYLTADYAANWTGSTVVIQVNASNVTIDLNGHTINNTAGTSTSAYGIYAIDRSGITVRNGNLVGFYWGISFFASNSSTASASFGHLIQDVCVTKCAFTSFYLNGVNNRIYRCRAVLEGGLNANYNNAFCLDGQGGSLEDCDACGHLGSATSYGVLMAGGYHFILNNRFSLLDVGVQCNDTTTKYRDNLTAGVTTSYANGTNAGNNN